MSDRRRPEKDHRDAPKSPRTAKSELRPFWRVFEYRRPNPVRPRFTI
jgi:hypothetical protein